MAALLAASLVRLAAAQCTLPVAMPPDTQLAATNPAECVAGAQPPFVSRGLPAAADSQALPANPCALSAQVA